MKVYDFRITARYGTIRIPQTIQVPSIDLTFDIPDYEPYNLDDGDEDQKHFFHDEESKLANFKKEMPKPLSVQNPKSKYKLCVFWSQPTSLSPSSIITEKIKYAHLDFCNSSFYRVLIQFWAPIRTERGCLQLVTLDQPFGLSKHLDEPLLRYRKHCLGYKFNVDDHHGEEAELGIPGRVFRQKWHHCIPDVRYYNSHEYPQRHFTQTFMASFAFPVFETSSRDCVGVLEFVSTRDFKDLFELCFWFFMDALKKEYLVGSLGNCFNDWVNSRSDWVALSVDSALIDKCLYHKAPVMHDQVYRDTLFEIKEGLKVVCTTHKLPLAQTWVPCVRGVLYVEKPASYVGDDNHDLLVEFRDYCILNDLRIEEGMVGKAYISRKPFFCKDVTQFSLTEYPFLPCARKCGFTGCFVICLQRTCTAEVDDDDFILEFFLKGENIYGKDPNTFLCSLLQTMKLHFRNFKLSSGEQLGKELWIQFIKPPMNQYPVSFQCPNTTSSSSSGPRVLNNGPEMMEPPSSNQQLISYINNEQKQNNTQVSCSITYEELRKHFGKKIEGVAEYFGVSRSTFKCKCRENGIYRWPQGKRRPDPLRSDLPSSEASTIATVTPPPPEVRTITIKAACGDDMLKFQLPFSSRMVELEEEVSKRLKLKNGTYKIKYTDEDGDRVLIACDKDLQDCMSASNSLGLNTIKMFIETLPKYVLQPD